MFPFRHTISSVVVDSSLVLSLSFSLFVWKSRRRCFSVCVCVYRQHSSTTKREKVFIHGSNGNNNNDDDGAEMCHQHVVLHTAHTHHITPRRGSTGSGSSVSSSETWSKNLPLRAVEMRVKSEESEQEVTKYMAHSDLRKLSVYFHVYRCGLDTCLTVVRYQ